MTSHQLKLLESKWTTGLPLLMVSWKCLVWFISFQQPVQLYRLLLWLNVMEIKWGDRKCVYVSLGGGRRKHSQLWQTYNIGTTPPSLLVEEYRKYIDSILSSSSSSNNNNNIAASSSSSSQSPCIAVHCISGIGRAPVFVAIALLDLSSPSLSPLDVVEFVRSKRRGAFNKKQVAWLLGEEAGSFKRRKPGNSGPGFFKKLFKKQ